MLERLALEQLHRDEELAVVLTDLMDRADVRMIERRRRARLAMEALHRPVVAGEILRQELERDVPAESEVLGVVDDAHPPAAKFAEHAIVGDCFVDHAGAAERMRDCMPRVQHGATVQHRSTRPNTHAGTS